MTLTAKSIALITYAADLRDSEGPVRYATGFFVETERYKKVCVTCAHVFEQHPGPDRDLIFVNGIPAKLLLNAAGEYGVDVALIEPPQQILEDREIHFHRLGRSRAVNRIYYSHGWSLLEGYRDAVKLVKIWGPRLERSTVQHLPPRPVTHTVWVLRNDVYDPQSGRQFSARNFAPGWSGAPVFNVRPPGERDRVIGVLSVVAEEGSRAVAVSIERLDFLYPADDETQEGWVSQVEPTVWEKLVGRLGTPPPPRFQIRYDQSEDPKLFHLRFTEITKQPVCPPVPEPPSPYDSSL
jgi:hypothetical protein